MKSLLSTIALCSLLMACSQGNQSAKTDTSMESELDPTDTQEVPDIPLDEEEAAIDDVASISARGRITAQESQSAFNVPGAIDYFLEIQSTNEQPFTLQGLKINSGRCGFSTGEDRKSTRLNSSHRL